MKPMKRFLCICAALAMTLSAATAMAADLTGTWTGEAKAPDGSSFPLTFTFKQDGATLTGSVLVGQGDPLPISNGKVDGNKFTFDDSFNGIVIHHDCTLDGDTIKVSTKSDSADFPGVDFTLTRKTDAPGKPTETAPGTPTAPATAPQ
jgi:opacity protein-like surface antigen